MACETCECVGIRSIVNNSNGTTTITLTNGTATTYQSRGLPGPQGPAGPAGENGQSVLQNQFPDVLNETRSFESLLEGRVAYNMPDNTLKTDGDMLSGYYQIKKTTDNPDTSGAACLYFNGVNLIVNEIDWPALLGTNTLLNVYFKIVRVSNTTIKYSFEVNTYGVPQTGGISRGITSSGEIDIATTNSLNLQTNAYDIDVLAKANEIGALQCTAFELIYSPKL